MGNKVGAIKIAAGKVGLTVDDYLSRVANGQKWCSNGRHWVSRSDFYSNRVKTDGLSPMCTPCRIAYRKLSKKQTSARRWKAPVDGAKMQANHRVTYLVSVGILPKPSVIPCSKCGHMGQDRKHEYHHFMGYAAEHHEVVECLCTKCHKSKDRPWEYSVEKYKVRSRYLETIGDRAHISEISRKVGRSLSAASKMASALVRANLLVRMARGVYGRVEKNTCHGSHA